MFINRFVNVNWDELFEYKDFDCVYWCFFDKYIIFYNDCFFFKKVKVKNVILSNFWIMKGFFKLICKKNLFYKCFFVKLILYCENFYKSYKNKLIYFF